MQSRLSERVTLLLRAGPPRRGHADTLAHSGWHRHNPPAGVTGALLPAAKTCPRYGACAEAFPSPGGVSRGGVRRSAGLEEAAGDGNPFCLELERFGRKAKAEQIEAWRRA